MSALTWSLVVCTYRRERVLPRCVRCALGSTRPPREVIVVDASPDWQRTRDAVLSEFTPDHPQVRFEYVQARRASLTAQRNQGLELCTADVAFMLDDDSLLFADSAERIMEVYEADVNRRIVALTPVFVVEVPDANVNPPAAGGEPTQGRAGADESRASPLRKLLRRLLWSDLQLLSYRGTASIARGGGPSPPYGAAELVKRFNLILVPFSTGSATFRTEVVRHARFEEMLERYAAGEDWDISERIKPLGLIAFCPGARQCHLEAPGGRLSVEAVHFLRYLNFMSLHVLHSTDVKRSRRLYRQFLWRRVISEALADLSKRRWGMPRARGTWRALRMLPAMFARSAREMREWYPQFQRKVIDADRLPNAAGRPRAF
ncbi:MAG TPA: glycosyltransferase family 2 protein [Tepidisphaeraceae bacterium]|jgi:glycosyltransferase involved in cell wall biosynthesis